MRLRDLFKNFGRAPFWLPPPNLTDEEQKSFVDEALQAVRVRLEALKAEVDVAGRRR